LEDKCYVYADGRIIYCSSHEEFARKQGFSDSDSLQKKFNAVKLTDYGWVKELEFELTGRQITSIIQVSLKQGVPVPVFLRSYLPNFTGFDTPIGWLKVKDLKILLAMVG